MGRAKRGRNREERRSLHGNTRLRQSMVLESGLARAQIPDIHQTRGVPCSESVRTNNACRARRKSCPAAPIRCR